MNGSTNFFLDAGKSILGRIRGLLSRDVACGDKFAQRRRHLRVVPPPTEVTCHFGRSSFTASLRDVSASGARLVTTRRLHHNTEISVVSRDRRSSDAVPVVRMRVVWSRTLNGRFEAGLRCLDDNKMLGRSWMMRVLKEGCGAASSSGDRRRTARISTALDVRVRASGEHRVQLADLSVGGACVRTDAHLAPGTPISLVLPACGESRGVTLEGEVLRASRVNDEQYVHVKFGTLQFEQKYRLEQHLSRLMQQAS